MGNTIKKTITIPKQDFEAINSYAKETGYSFSEIVQKATKALIHRSKEMTLAEYLNSYCEAVSDEEQADFDKMQIDFDNIDGREILPNELL